MDQWCLLLRKQKRWLIENLNEIMKNNTSRRDDNQPIPASSHRLQKAAPRALERDDTR